MLSNQPTKENVNLVNLYETDFEFLSGLQRTLYEMINVDMSTEELLHRILKSYRLETSYISIVHLTGKVKFSLNEIKRLSTFNDFERRVLEYVLLSDKRNENIKVLVGLIKKELEVNEDVVSEYQKENITVNKLWSELEREYDSKFRNQRLRGGIKKLIIKSAIISYTLNDNNW